MKFAKFLEETSGYTANKLRKNGKDSLADLYEKCYESTLKTTVKIMEDGTTFLVTGDIPAMWLRDSSAQVCHYLPWADRYPETSDLIQGLIQRQFRYIDLDPYANAFNPEPNGACYTKDKMEIEESPWIWERKYEIDSLCYPIHLAYQFWKTTGRTDWADSYFRSAADKILALWTREQNHEENSPYRFTRENCPPTDTLHREGKGAPVVPTGMTWSGFRPSDDACVYGYLIPSNLFAAAVLKKLAEIAEQVINDSTMAEKARKLSAEISDGVKQYGIVEREGFGKIYAYETDGQGNYVFMDDANVPSLLSLPYLGCCDVEDEIYQNTRRFILSKNNPYYYEGKVLKGIGSPHTPENYVWHISLSMQGLTANNREEMEAILSMIENSHAGTLQMHEGVNVDNPEEFTRPWFAWANSIFSEFVAYYTNQYLK